MLGKLKKDIEGAIDIEDMVVTIVLVAVGAIILGALLPVMTSSLAELPATVGGMSLGPLINLVPLLVVLAFVIAIVMWAVGYFKKNV